MQLKVLSWNIWVDGHFDDIKDLLTCTDADVIGLQEVKDNDLDRDVIRFLSGQGYEHAFAPVRKAWGDKVFSDGPAIFSRYPILREQEHLLSEQNTRVAIQADLQVGDSVLQVFSTHLLHTHQKNSEVQNVQVENLLKVVPKEHAIVMGDFNATPESATIQAMKKALVDTDPASSPTWSVYPEGCPACNPQAVDTRLDYIFVTKDLQSSDFHVEQSKGSDHLPILVSIEIP